jgi:hypothetical protein
MAPPSALSELEERLARALAKLLLADLARETPPPPRSEPQRVDLASAPSRAPTNCASRSHRDVARD